MIGPETPDLILKVGRVVGECRAALASVR